MNNNRMKDCNADVAIIKKTAARKDYSTPHLVCYGDLNELTLDGGNNPLGGDFIYPFETGYGDID